MKNIYEVFDEFELAWNVNEKKSVIERNLSPLLVEVLRLTFHPSFQWKVKEYPENYVEDYTKHGGLSECQLNTELRKLYLFQEGHPSAENLNARKQKELLLQLLESLEPREAEVVMGILKKDQGVEGLTYDFVKECFPNMLP